MTRKRDVVILNANVRTVDDHDSVARAVLMSGGKFAAVGTEAEVRATALWPYERDGRNGHGEKRPDTSDLVAGQLGLGRSLDGRHPEPADDRPSRRHNRHARPAAEHVGGDSGHLLVLQHVLEGYSDLRWTP